MKLIIERHSSSEAKTVEVTEYDAKLLNEQINDETINTVVIGDKIISRIDVKLVEPVEEPAEPTT